MVSERLMSGFEIAIDRRFLIEGQLRSYNIVTENKSRLQLQTFARDISEAQSDEDINNIVLDGYICKLLFTGLLLLPGKLPMC